MKTITDHQVNECNQAIAIEADEPDAKYGNASHMYTLTISRHTPRGSAISAQLPDRTVVLIFQRGPIKEVGVNGLTNEALLAVVIDRLRGFQSGPFSCRENAIALTKLEEAQHWLQSRTRARVARGVEGTNVV